MPDLDRKAMVDEAADIFVRLRQDPENLSIQGERDRFIERGSDERDVYEQVAKAWEGAGRRAGPNKSALFALLGGLVATSYFAAEPTRNFLLADFVTGTEVARIDLASGDIASLDAATALADHTDGDARRVTLFDGAALFDVAKDGRPFEVSAGEVTIEVLGTTFETTRFGKTVSVSVSEGRVRVSDGSSNWILAQGDSLLWFGPENVETAEIDTGQVALWREDRFVSDGLTFAQVADVIDRRLPVSVFVGGASLAGSRVSGTINLSEPEEALQTLAGTRGARLVDMGPLGYLILP